MPLRIEPHAEPIPGYRLLDRIGSGGFGEVWKAEAPGGLFKAIKFVKRGSATVESILASGESDRSRADQEWKSLLRVKSVRHPFILLLDRFEIIENYLVIVMELADRTLADRFKECRVQGLPGIPRDELLGYLAEAAEVLDLMNSQYQLQHLDIKPANLFLVHQHIKVADFGLVKDTTDGKSLMTITGGVTPVYAAPETFDGQFSRQSDQYSLAIVYQEMLTGQRPFSGSTMKQLVLQHVQNAHDLSSAPVNDRPILARALARLPDDRYPTCSEFLQALRKATTRGDVVAAPVAPTSDKPMPSLGSKTLGARGSAGPVKRAEPNFPLEALLNKRAAGASDQPSQMSATLPPPKAMPAERGAATPAAAPRRKPRAPQLARESTGIVQPALVIGIGSLGVETLTQLKKQIAIELGSLDALPQVRLLAIDTDPEAVRAPDDAGPIGVRPQEFFLARLLRASNYLKTRDGKLPTNSWLSPKLLHRIPREQNSAGLRPLGRLAFVDNYRPLARRVEAELQALTCQDTPHDSDPGHELGVRTTRPRVYLATSLTGNTGSGMFIDFAYLVRRILAEQGHEDAEIVGLFYLPAVSRDGTSFAPVASAYASLVELQHYCRPESLFTAHYETAASTVKGGDDATLSGPAFQRCILLPLTEIKGRMDESVNAPLLAQAGAFLYRDLATTLGPVHDEQRNALLDGNEMSAAATLVQSFGMFRIHWPRHAVLEQAARGLSARLVARWMEKDATNLADTIRQWSQERWEALGMRSENLIETFQRCSEASLGQKAELMLAEVLLPVQQALGASSAKQTAGAAKVLVGPIVKAMENLERLIGVPEDSRASRANFEPSTMERVFSDIANDVADGCEQKLAELAVMLLEDPNFRLAGAEEALRQFSQTVEQALQAQEKLAQELTDKARQLYYRLQQLIDMPLKSASPSMSGATTSRPISVSLGKLTPTDLFELVRTYTKTRYHSLVLAHLNRAYVSLRGHLSDQVRDVGFCRTRLGELMGLLHPASLNVRPGAASLERALFPPGCVDLADAAHQLLRSVTPEDLVAFDERVQSWVESHFQALLQVCLGSSSTVRNLAPMIVHEAESYLGERLPAASVAEMYLTRQAAEHEEAADDSIRDDLEKCLEHATSELGSISAHNEFTLVTLPDDEAGKRVAELLRDRHPDAKILFSDRSEEIIFFHETIRIRWKDLEQFGPTAREAYERRSAGDPNSVHSREDVFDWQFVLAGENR